jgi:hypothetical protein
LRTFVLSPKKDVLLGGSWGVGKPLSERRKGEEMNEKMSRKE